MLKWLSWLDGFQPGQYITNLSNLHHMLPLNWLVNKGTHGGYSWVFLLRTNGAYCATCNFWARNRIRVSVWVEVRVYRGAMHVGITQEVKSTDTS